MPTTQLQPPDRDALRALYDAAVAEINMSRDGGLLTTEFYAKTGDAMFDIGCLALGDAISDTRRMHTVSAPAGGGKTSFAYALIAAVARHAENDPTAPYGCAFVVDQRKKADEVYRDLNALLPGKVKIWTTDHDVNNKQPEKVENPAARFAREDLKHSPVIVVTHRFYLGTRGHNARNVVRNGIFGDRALTIVDERPDEAPSQDIMLSEAQTVREALVQSHPETREHLDALLRFMEQYSYAPANQLYRPGVELDMTTITKSLGWFNSDVAERLERSVTTVPGVDRLFSFARALVTGRGYVATSGALAHFFSYETKRVIDLAAGTILLDATADIDGVNNIVTWRTPSETPRARFDNLEIIHVRQHTKVRLSEYLKKASNRRAYMQWVEQTIRDNMSPGEKGLVVCKKTLFDNECIPNWETNDPRFKTPKVFSEDYGWNIDGRKLCATHWGTGVGSNTWNDADVVFLFDEFFHRRQNAIATTQGLRGHRVDEGDLGSMRTLNAKARGVDMIAEGHVLRWTKQLALRGKARFYDSQGVCGKQRLVIGSDLKRFSMNVSRLFPNAKITMADTPVDAPLAPRVIEFLRNAQVTKVRPKDLSRYLGRPWRSVSGKLLTPVLMTSVASLGWRYVKGLGRSGSYFERTPKQQTQGALSPFLGSSTGPQLAT
jgi:hypothetical protein